MADRQLYFELLCVACLIYKQVFTRAFGKSCFCGTLEENLLGLRKFC